MSSNALNSFQSGSRLPYIDLAKGFCILIVVYGHVSFIIYPAMLTNPIINSFSPFRIPLYFFLSGLFFKTYGNLRNFALHKTNKLLVPFFFWHLTLSLALPVLLYVLSSGSLSLSPAKDNLLAILHNQFPLNTPLWFLLALFVTNILFFALVSLSDKLSRVPQPLTLILTSILAAILATLLRSSNTHLPLFIDSALAAMPYFAAGFLVRSKTNLLFSPMNWKSFLVLIICFASLAVPFCINTYFIDIRTNTFNVNPFLAYLIGFSGIAFIMLLAKTLVKLPIISYVGRYSIIVLVLHYPLISILGPFIDKLCGLLDLYVKSLILFLVIVTISIACIPLCRKFLPKFTAQKDLFPTQH